MVTTKCSAQKLCPLYPRVQNELNSRSCWGQIQNKCLFIWHAIFARRAHKYLYFYSIDKYSFLTVLVNNAVAQYGACWKCTSKITGSSHT